MAELSLTIPRPTPSLNRLLACPPTMTAAQHASRNRRFWRGRSGWGGWCALVVAALPPRWPRPRAHAEVVITRHGARALDRDNLVGGCKGLVDILVDLGLLVDDSPEWAELRYRQEAPTPARERRTEILLEW